MTTIPDDVTEALIDAIELMGDHTMARAGAMEYRDSAAVLEPLVAAAGAPRLAWPSMIIRPDVRTTCFVMIADGAVVAGWRTGLFKKRPHALAVRRTPAFTATLGKGTTAATRGADILTVSGDGEEITVALPPRNEAFAAQVRQLLGLP